MSATVSQITDNSTVYQFLQDKENIKTALLKVFLYTCVAWYYQSVFIFKWHVLFIYQGFIYIDAS